MRSLLSRSANFPLPALLVLVIQTLALGFVGLRASHAALIERLLGPQFLAPVQSPNPLVETVWKSLLYLGTGHTSWLIAWGVHLLFALITAWLLFGFLKRQGSLIAAHVGSLAFVLHPWTAGELSTLSGTFIATALMLGIVRAVRVPWIAAPLVWILGGALLLVWPPMLLWAALLLVGMMVVSNASPKEADKGTLAGAWLPLPLLTAPVMVPIVAHAMNPTLWSGLKTQWLIMLQASWLPTLPGAWFAGYHWADGHLPWWSGLALLGSAIGLIPALFAILGALHTKRVIEAWTPLVGILTCVMLCWILPQGVSGVVDVTAMMPLWLAWLIGHGVHSAMTYMEDHNPTKKRAAIGLVASLVLLPSLVATLSYNHHTSSWRSALGSSVVATPNRLERDSVLPKAALQAAKQPIWAAPKLRPLIKANQKLRLGIQPTNDASKAGAMLDQFEPSSTRTPTPAGTTPSDGKSVTSVGPGEMTWYLLAQ